METIHKLRDRTGAFSNTVSKLFRMKNFRRKSKEFKDPVVLNDGGTHTYTHMNKQSTSYNTYEGPSSPSATSDHSSSPGAIGSSPTSRVSEKERRRK